MNATIDFGIDLGTTNSCVACCEVAGVRVFTNNDQMNVTPSAIYINRAGRRVIGLRASSASRKDPGNGAVEFKRWMGQKHRQSFPASNQSLSAEELSAEILKSLREDVRRHTGIDMTAAVITVPAAFGSLQCEATARAAELAGIEHMYLLQEPIAAAVAYGARAESIGQRWLVFDLGGGTLDIAVVSTREGRLHVIAHMGKNLLGGKDIDQLIVDKVFLPAIKQQSDVRSVLQGGTSHPLIAQLPCEAERAKIALSTDTRVSVSLFDLGDDDAGKPIELELELMRIDLESLIEPLLDECIVLARSALAEARIGSTDLDRILLVGGPTQSPILRSRLSRELGAPVDFSSDPMTAVARGAALYASTLPRKPSTTLTSVGSRVALRLAYEPVSADLSCEIEGRVESRPHGLEAKIDALQGAWTSGWLPLMGGAFVTKLQLRKGEVSTFRVYLRDQEGRSLDTDTSEFKIRHGLVPSAPPLPHSISIEVVSHQGKPALDLIFAKGTPLPTAKNITYRAAHTLIPGKRDSDIYIKLWEGEFFEAPEANDWIANLILGHDGVERRLPAGAEIEVNIQISESRLITVTAVAPSLNQQFTNAIYLPQRDEEDLQEQAENIAKELGSYFEELQELLDRRSAETRWKQPLEEIRSSLVDLEYKVSFDSGHGKSTDPDAAKRIVSEAKVIRGRLLVLRHRMDQSSIPQVVTQFLAMVKPAVEVIERYGNSLEKQALASLRLGLDRSIEGEDDTLTTRIAEEISRLRDQVLIQQEWYWRDWFESLCGPGRVFGNACEAKRLISQGRRALKDGDEDAVKDAVRSLQMLLPKAEAEEARGRAHGTGISPSY